MRNLRPAWVFDFSVRVPEHVVTAMQGESIEVPVMVELDKGQPQPVMLTVATNWAKCQCHPPDSCPGGRGRSGAAANNGVSQHSSQQLHDRGAGRDRRDVQDQ